MSERWGVLIDEQDNKSSSMVETRALDGDDDGGGGGGGRADEQQQQKHLSATMSEARGSAGQSRQAREGRRLRGREADD